MGSRPQQATNSYNHNNERALQASTIQVNSLGLVARKELGPNNRHNLAKITLIRRKMVNHLYKYKRVRSQHRKDRPISVAT